MQVEYDVRLIGHWGALLTSVYSHAQQALEQHLVKGDSQHALAPVELHMLEHSNSPYISSHPESLPDLILFGGTW